MFPFFSDFFKSSYLEVIKVNNFQSVYMYLGANTLFYLFFTQRVSWRMREKMLFLLPLKKLEKM